MTMMPFDYEAVQNGAKVVTRMGTTVDEIGLFPSLKQPVICSINGQAEAYSMGGHYKLDAQPSAMDLFIEVEAACDCHKCKVLAQAKKDLAALEAYLNATPVNNVTLGGAYASLAQLIDVVENY